MKSFLLARSVKAELCIIFQNEGVSFHTDLSPINFLISLHLSEVSFWQSSQHLKCLSALFGSFNFCSRPSWIIENDYSINFLKYVFSEDFKNIVSGSDYFT